MNLNWIKGRQNSGYKKLKLLQYGNNKRGGFDLYLLKFIQGNYIKPHIDQIKNKRHYRINFELVRAEKGGNFEVVDPIFKFWRLYIFRSDLSTHSVTVVEKGSRYVLSLGIAI